VERTVRRGEASAEVRDLGERRLRATDGEVTSYVGMTVFLGSWAMMFAALFFSYAVVRAHAPAWPPPGSPALPVLVPGLNTLVVAASSAAVAVGVRAHALRRRSAPALALGAALGALFLGLQLLVWIRVWQSGLVPSGGPYPSVFYALTVFHALHALVGIAALAVLAARGFAGRAASRSAVRLWGMFWHFVGAVWCALYAAVYLA